MLSPILIIIILIITVIIHGHHLRCYYFRTKIVITAYAKLLIYILYLNIIL